MSPSVAENLRPYDHLVAFNQFGASTMAQALKEAALRNDHVFPRNFEIIPHGVERSNFYPLDGRRGEDRSLAKKQLFPDTEDFQNSFVVFNGNRNQSRKRIDVTMKGFALFAKDKPSSVKLYLHMGTRDLGWDIVELAKRLGIDDRLLLTSRSETLAWESKEMLNTIFNACDVGINTSNGEGWGLVSFEHAATGACQIVPGHTGCGELWNGVADLLKPSWTSVNTSLMTDDQNISHETVAVALEKLYSDPIYRASMAKKAFDFVNQDRFCWKRIGQHWVEYLERIAQTHPTSQ